MKRAYMPIDPVYFELFEQETVKKESRIIYFAFTDEPALEECRGKILKTGEVDSEGVFIFLNNGDKVRADRVVVINGKPGPAFDEYDAYALAPLTCQGGYDDCSLE
ncbi:MAG: hypothetical protein PHQ77_00630 [Proteiniphilum sp.]|jgi:hypothetical protein|nr:hypothetical protein [Proteiniphilum sp.]